MDERNLADFSLHFFVQKLLNKHKYGDARSAKLGDFIKQQNITNLVQAMMLKLLLGEGDNKLDNFALKKEGDKIIIVPIDFEQSLSPGSTLA